MKNLIESANNVLIKESLQASISRRNKGREGKPIVNSEGDEVKDTIYLGDGAYLMIDGSEKRLRITDRNSVNIINLNSKVAKVLKKVL